MLCGTLIWLTLVTAVSATVCLDDAAMDLPASNTTVTGRLEQPYNNHTAPPCQGWISNRGSFAMYRLTATSSSAIYQASLWGASGPYDLYLSVYRGCPDRIASPVNVFFGRHHVNNNHNNHSTVHDHNSTTSDEARCVPHNDHSNTVQWQATDKEDYYLVVHAPYGQGFEYALQLTSLEFAPGMDIRLDAVTLDDAAGDWWVTGSIDNTSSRYYSNLQWCGGDARAPAAVYNVRGTDNHLVSAVVAGFGFDPHLAVYQENVNGSLACVEDLHYYHGHHQVTWMAGQSESYFVVVFASDYRTGNYALQIGTVTGTDFCETTINLGAVVNQESVVHSGSITGDGSANFEAPFCNASTGHGVGTASVLHTVRAENDSRLTATVFLATSRPGFDVSVGVFTGTCDALQCVSEASSFGPRSISWMAKATVDYYVMITRCCSFDLDSDYILLIEEENGSLAMSGSSPNTEDEPSGTTSTTKSAGMSSLARLEDGMPTQQSRTHGQDGLENDVKIPLESSMARLKMDPTTLLLPTLAFLLLVLAAFRD